MILFYSERNVCRHWHYDQIWWWNFAGGHFCFWTIPDTSLKGQNQFLRMSYVVLKNLSNETCTSLNEIILCKLPHYNELLTCWSSTSKVDLPDFSWSECIFSGFMDRNKCNFDKCMFAYFNCQPLKTMNTHSTDVTT